MKNVIYIMSIFFTTFLFITACIKNNTDEHVPVIATLTTSVTTAITSTSALSGGNITNTGGATITERGICFSTTNTPTISSNKVINGSGTGSFTSNMTGLTPGTTYYVRAYAINNAGIAYGNEYYFNTGVNLANVSTNTVSAITSLTATSGGNISNAGGGTITERGICFNTTPNPTISNSKVLSGSGIGGFTSNMAGLSQGTTYYVRAYAINNAGTAYGNEVSFFTPYQTVTIGTQVWMLKNLDVGNFRNGDPITQVTDQGIWTTRQSEAYCYFQNNSLNGTVYGKLYNWFAVNDPRGLAPLGWHIASDAEWTIMSNYLGGDAVSGDKIKEAGTIHWIGPNSATTNSSGLTCLPGGWRRNDGIFYNIGYVTYFWTSTVNITWGGAWHRGLLYNYGNTFRNYDLKQTGYSVRCVKD